MNKRTRQLQRTMEKRNRYSKEQIWNLDIYLTDHICCALKQFRNQKMYSYPNDPLYNYEKIDKELHLFVKFLQDLWI